MNLFGIERETLEYIVTLAAAAGVIYTCYRAAKRPYLKIMNAVERMSDTADAVLGSEGSPGLVARSEEQMALLEQLKNEVLPNHGSSMNDRISLMLGETRSRLDSDHHTAYFSANRYGEFVWVSRSFLKWFGCKPEDTHGFRWLGLIHPDDRDAVAEEWQYAIKAGRQTRLETIRLQTGANTWLTVYFDAQPIYGGASLVIGFHGWVRISSNQPPQVNVV